MKIMVSACLLGENCKYNGGNNRNQALLTLLKKEKGQSKYESCSNVFGGHDNGTEISQSFFPHRGK